MSEPQVYLWLIPALPLLASVVIAFLGPRLLRGWSHLPCILAVAGSFVCALLLLLHVVGQPPAKEFQFPVSNYVEQQTASDKNSDDGATEKHAPIWFQVSDPGNEHNRVTVTFGLVADPLTAIMLTMITFIGTFIAIFSVGYMHGEEGYPRFFAEVSLFIFSMTTLVLADNLLLLYLGWEGVGLCSYLLIGFWYRKPSASAAARKAFLVTRIGDVGLMLGILLLWATYGVFSYTDLFNAVRKPHFNSEMILYGACLLIFLGAAGKSAQFPLHVWLPDAMEGPTPVSALIHAATMVTAGVYLVARCTPLFILAPEAQLIVACIGAFTALLAGLIALTQTDLKRVLAYSTLSQLGYMFLALGCAVFGSEGSQTLVTFAVVAAIFHLFTHAFFKALLFLSAGSVMHAMGGVIDMRRFSGLRKLMPTTHIGFLCGALALAGVPIFSGFWSKDEILASAWKASVAGGRYDAIYLVLLLVGLLTAGLTGFYTFRAYFMTFWGEEKIPHEAGHHAHESPHVMTVPLLVLAVFALGAGLVLGPTHLIAGFLEKASFTGEFEAEHAGMNVVLMLVSSLIALGGVGVAWLMYIKKPSLPAEVARASQPLYQLSLNKFYIDEIYAVIILAPLDWLAKLSATGDLRFIDRLVDLIGGTPRFVGGMFRYVQNGLVQFYALAMVLGLTVFILALLRHLS
jgi:NADH-quinone oxidoreductase subunit L